MADVQACPRVLDHDGREARGGRGGAQLVRVGARVGVGVGVRARVRVRVRVGVGVRVRARVAVGVSVRVRVRVTVRVRAGLELGSGLEVGSESGSRLGLEEAPRTPVRGTEASIACP